MDGEWIDRGRVHQCTLCNYRGEKKSAIKHFEDKHLGDHDFKYRCMMCQFRCNVERDFDRHPNHHAQHKKRKAEFEVKGFSTNTADYKIEYPSFKVVDPDVCLIRWNVEDSQAHWRSKSKRRNQNSQPVFEIASRSNVQSTCTVVVPSVSVPSTCISVPVSTVVPALSMSVPVTTFVNVPSMSSTCTVMYTAVPVSTPVQSVTCTVPPLKEDVRLVLDENVIDSVNTDDLMHKTLEESLDLQETMAMEAAERVPQVSPAVMQRPEPLRSPVVTVPRPSLQDIPFPPPSDDIEEDITSQLLGEESDSFTVDSGFTMQEGFRQLTAAIKDQTEALRQHNTLYSQIESVLKDINRNISRNIDSNEKIEIAVRRLYNNPVPPKSPPRNRFSTFNRQPVSYNRPPPSSFNRRRPYPTHTATRSPSRSPVKKLKSAVRSPTKKRSPVQKNKKPSKN